MSGTNTLISKPDVILTRLETSSEGTFGKVVCRGEVLFSGELPNKDNLSNVSCIPTGTYKAAWSYSSRFKKWMYEIVSVNNRTGIRIHSANFMGDESKKFKKQLNGCISLGLKLGVMDGQKAVLLSKPAIRKFEDLMEKKSFVLEIK